MKPSGKRILRAFLVAPYRRMTTGQICQPDVGGISFRSRMSELTRDYGIEFDSERVGDHQQLYTLVTDKETVLRAIASASTSKATSVTDGPTRTGVGGTQAPEDSDPSERTAVDPGSGAGASTAETSPLPGSLQLGGDLGAPARLFDIEDARAGASAALTDQEAA